MHAVYRMFDQAGRLLYIGISGRAGHRFDQHAEKRWFPLVSLITLEWHAAQAEAVLAERRAIAAEKPRYNVAGKTIPLKRGTKAKPPEPPGMIALSDVLAVFDDAKGLHWEVIAHRLARKFPQRWEGTTKEEVSARCRSLGVKAVNVRMGPKVLKGCCPADVEQAMACYVLKGVS